jgi:hypothetical protein
VGGVARVDNWNMGGRFDGVENGCVVSESGGGERVRDERWYEDRCEIVCREGESVDGEEMMVIV